MSQFQDMNTIEGQIKQELAQNPQATEKDAQAAADKVYNQWASTNPTGKYSKKFGVKVLLAVGVAGLIATAVLFVSEHRAATTYLPADAVVTNITDDGGTVPPAYELRYVMDGVTHVGTLNYYGSWQVGDTIPVLVDPVTMSYFILADQYHYIGTTTAGGATIFWFFMVWLYYYVLTPWADRFNRRYYEKQAMRMKGRI